MDKAGNTEHWKPLEWRYIHKPRTHCRIEDRDRHGSWHRLPPRIFLEPRRGEQIQLIRYSIDSGDWREYSSSLDDLPEGSHTVRWIGKGGDGRDDAEQTLTVNIDLSPPACERSITIRRGQGILELNARDEHSGTLRIEYRLNNGPVMIYQGPVSLPPGDQRIEYRALDRAGNQSDWTTIDTYVPTEGGR